MDEFDANRMAFEKAMEPTTPAHHFRRNASQYKHPAIEWRWRGWNMGINHARNQQLGNSK